MNSLSILEFFFPGVCVCFPSFMLKIQEACTFKLWEMFTTETGTQVTCTMFFFFFWFNYEIPFVCFVYLFCGEVDLKLLRPILMFLFIFVDLYMIRFRVLSSLENFNDH